MTFENFCDEVAETEGKKEEVTIGNVRETVSIVFSKLKKMTISEVAELLESSTK